MIENKRKQRMAWVYMIKYLALVLSVCIRAVSIVVHILIAPLKILRRGLRAVKKKWNDRKRRVRKKRVRKKNHTKVYRWVIHNVLLVVIKMLYAVRLIGTILCNKVKWGWIVVRNKVHWRLIQAKDKLRWVLHTNVKKKWCQRIFKNDYVDLFLVFIRNDLKKERKKLQILRVDGIRHYIQEHGGVIHEVEEEKERNVCVPAYFEKQNMHLEYYESREIYIAQLQDAVCTGASDLIQAEGLFLNDAAYNDRLGRLEIRYGAVKKVCKNIALVEKSQTETLIEKGICLVRAASFNYYHLVIEILAKLAFADQLEEYRDYPILVDEVVLRVPQYAAALSYLNCYKHEIIPVNKDEQCYVKEMIWISDIAWMPVNVKYRNDLRASDFMVAKSALNYLRECMPLYQEKIPWRKIFISRKNTALGRLKNEESVRNALEQYGFETVFTEEMTLEQQIECFGQAKCVVAATGAALTNMIFCQKGTRIGCIVPEQFRFYMYSTIAYYLDLEPVFLDAEITKYTDFISSDTFEADVEYVKRYAETLLG